MDEPHSHALRRGRRSIPGQIYLLTAVCRDRRACFRELSAARVLVLALRYQAEHGRAESLAHVVMPDHFHWLMQLSPGADLSAVMCSVKRRTGLVLGRRIWQPGFHDRALRRDEDLRDVARYVVANPLRAGLVTSLRDYPHWDAVWL